MDYQN